ncbi:hemolysin family protein [Anaerococcus murdochii]|uniref:Hemolysin family protein n=1 Tax=Anaerococcus murdochii TaxID=411577 RepID=A0ABS7SZC9_9FIRM|nr:hemolysin family protein [Anaerococcus murdochii]MBZ2386903.1 hemolysin family protein [Anaerococcus murdochii]
MSTTNWIELIVIIVGVIGSAFFSSSETALTSLNVFKIRQMEENGVENSSLVRKLTDDIGKVLTTILIGNNIVNIATTTVATIFFTDLFGPSGAIISTIVLTLTILIFGEVTPKNIASSSSEKVALKVAKPIKFFDFILKPMSFFLQAITNFLTRLLIGENAKKGDLVTEEDLKTIVDVSEEQGVINDQESEIINNVFEFGDSDVEDIMTARTNMEAIAVDMEDRELKDFLKNCKHSRIPVYGKSIDNIIGILHMKDIVAFIAEDKALNIEEMVRPAFYVYDNMHIFDLFKSMRGENVSLAIVIDEYGGTSGIVTIEDIVEELVGEIEDEYDTHLESILKINDKEYLVNPSIHINDFNDYFDTDLVQIKNDSIGGFLIDKIGRIPKLGDSIEEEGIKITVVQINRYKLEMLKVEFS